MYDRRGVLDACTSSDPDVMLKVAQLKQHILDVPPMPVRVDPTSHEHLIADYI